MAMFSFMFYDMIDTWVINLQNLARTNEFYTVLAYAIFESSKLFKVGLA